MRVLVVLPRDLPPVETVKRVIASLSWLARPIGAVHLAAPAPLVATCEAVFPQWKVVLYRATRSERECDAVVYLPGAERPKRTLRGLRVYSATAWGQLERDGPIDEVDYPYLRTHAFNRLGPRTDQFRFFPYVFTQLRTGLGPTNEYGHRIRVDMSALASRPSRHRVVAVFGNSSTESIYCHFDEMFTSVLEELLNRRSAVRYTVLNFGVTAAPLFYETVSYLLFCEQLRPEIVISNSGFVDLVNGQISDPYLLNKLRLTYYNPLERWAQVIHGTDAEPFTWPRSGGPTPPGDHPRAIIAAYLRRRQQFGEVVQGAGATFITTLQPLIFSKQASSPYELGWVSRHPAVATGVQRPLFENTRHLYPRLIEAIQADRSGPAFLNIHDHFGKYGADVTLFEDFVHTTPAGDRLVAEYLDGFLRDHVIAGRRSTRGA